MLLLLLLLMMMMKMTIAEDNKFPRPCTDLKPIDLLRYLVPDRNELPPSLEIAYDRHSAVHAFRFLHPFDEDTFLHSHHPFSFLAARLLSTHGRPAGTRCAYFPEEFSLLFTFKMSDRRKLKTAEVAQCLFAITRRGSDRPKLAVRLRKSRLQLFYPRHTRFTTPHRYSLQVVEMKGVPVFDGSWHSVVLSVTADRVATRTDCGKRKQRRLRRPFPTRINIRFDDIHIATCGRRASERFRGLLKDVILLAGSDLSSYACPSNRPSLSQFPVTPLVGGAAMDPAVSWQKESCGWSETGKLHYDVYRRSLQVCYSGVWQSVLQHTDRQYTGRMDYIVWHQDLVTSAPVSDLEIFRVPDEGLFLAAATLDRHEPRRKQQSTLFKWSKDHFTVYQSLYTLGAFCWEHFVIGKRFYLAVANQGISRHRASKSLIYVWSRRRRRFRLHQELITWSARDLEHFSIDGRHYLIVANDPALLHDGLDNVTWSQSVLYEWVVEDAEGEGQGRFKDIQTIEVTGARDWTHFTVDSYHFLVVATSSSSSSSMLSVSQQNSVIYFWQRGRFIPFQTIKTWDVVDWEFFRIGNDYYLVSAAAATASASSSSSMSLASQASRARVAGGSTVYRLDKVRKQFDVYQHITTRSVYDWEEFRVGNDHFLISAEYYTTPDSVRANARTTSRAATATSSSSISSSSGRGVIYRWQGTEKFVPVHWFDTPPATDWETFTTNTGQIYLVCSNGQAGVSQVYSVQMV